MHRADTAIEEILNHQGQTDVATRITAATRIMHRVLRVAELELARFKRLNTGLFFFGL